MSANGGRTCCWPTATRKAGCFSPAMRFTSSIPTGGLGMNTGVGDAVDLAWKLAGTLQGWGGAEPARLLRDRAPAGRRAQRRGVAFRHHGTAQMARRLPARDSRRHARRRRSARQPDADRECRAAQVQRDDRCRARLPLCGLAARSSPEPGEGPPDNPMEYVPTTWPGARLPHAWLDDGTALHDRLGDGYTLLCLGGARQRERAACARVRRLRGAVHRRHRHGREAARHLRPRYAAAAARPACRLAGQPPARPARTLGGDSRPAIDRSVEMKPSRDIARLIEIMAALRTPGSGCPWDLEQDFGTIAPYTIEEAYEVADAIGRGDLDDLKDELGRPAAAGRVPRAHGRGTGRVRVRRRRAGDQRKAHSPPSACVRRQGRDERPARSMSSGTRSRRRRQAARARARQSPCPRPRRRACRCLARAAGARARAQAAAEGRQGRLRLERSEGGAGQDPRGSRRDRCGAGERRTGEGGGRDRRSAVRDGQPRAPSRRRSRDRAAHDKSQIRAKVRGDRGRARGRRQEAGRCLARRDGRAVGCRRRPSGANQD